MAVCAPFPLPTEVSPWLQPGWGAGYPFPPVTSFPLPEARGLGVLAATEGQAKQELRRGDLNVNVNTRAEAERIFYELYGLQEYMNTTGRAKEDVQWEKENDLSRTYHWDELIYSATPGPGRVPLPVDPRGRALSEYEGRLAYHDLDDSASRYRHLQIHITNKIKIYIFYGEPLW
jgi:hypothetical protein